jgi:hypothetical protein
MPWLLAYLPPNPQHSKHLLNYYLPLPKTVKISTTNKTANPTQIFDYQSILPPISSDKLAKKDAPALRRQHLLDIQKAAEDRGDSNRSAIILEILT